MTDVQRNQIMGNENAAVFQRHYINQTVKVNTQSTYLGTTKRRDLIEAVGLVGARRDPQAPTKSDGQCKYSENPKLRELLGLKEILYSELKRRYGTLAKAAQQHPLKSKGTKN